MMLVQNKNATVLQDASPSCVSGQKQHRHVWVSDPELVHTPAEVVNEFLLACGQMLQIRLLGTGELRQVAASEVTSLHPSCLQGVPDLLELGELDMPALLHNIRIRYTQDRIYTSVGFPILISVNPYRPLPNLYSTSQVLDYRRATDLDKLPPHPFAIAQRALDAICRANDAQGAINQSVIISGESGAGKTEATKILLSFLAANDAGECASSALEAQLTQSNPLLEAFGNAKTIRNDNSSRFGKFSEVLILRNSRRIVGARISSYLLEKSRIVRQQPLERNYHIFYQLCTGGVTKFSPELQQELQLKPASEFQLLRTCHDVAGRNDAKDFEEILTCLEALEFPIETSADVWRILAGILHLGEVKFSSEDEDIDGGARVVNEEQLEIAARLLALPRDHLSEVLCFSSIRDAQTRDSIKSPKTAPECEVSRDSLCKTIYERLFQWLIGRVNSTVAGAFGGNVEKTSVGSIGLLDIFGFEVFDENSFEQLCINFANEQLQQRFNCHVFAEEQTLYQSEGIAWSHIHFTDNAHILEALTDRAGGVLPLLDSECLMPRGSDSSFLAKMHRAADHMPAVVLRCRSVKHAAEFGVRHYAGDVYYNVAGMLAKNRDQPQREVLRLLESSGNGVLSAAAVGADCAGFAKSSVSCVFRKQLHELMEVLSATNASYLRCIKPNDAKQPRVFSSAEVLRQLRCAGMLESIRIRRAGYELRFTYKQFNRMFAALLRSIGHDSSSGSSSSGSERSLAHAICMHLVTEAQGRPEDLLFQLGHTKVFLKEWLYSVGERKIDALKQAAFTRIKAAVRGYVARQRVKWLRRANQALTAAAFAAVWSNRLLLYRRQRRARAARKILLALKLHVAWVTRERQRQAEALKEEESSSSAAAAAAAATSDEGPAPPSTPPRRRRNVPVYNLQYASAASVAATPQEPLEPLSSQVGTLLARCHCRNNRALRSQQQQEELIDRLRGDLESERQKNKALQEALKKLSDQTLNYEARYRAIDMLLQEAIRERDKALEQQRRDKVIIGRLTERIEMLKQEKSLVTDELLKAKDQISQKKAKDKMTYAPENAPVSTRGDAGRSQLDTARMTLRHPAHETAINVQTRNAFNFARPTMTSRGAK